MNVVPREKLGKTKQSRSRNELVRKDLSLGIRGATSIPAHPCNSLNNGPRYQFNNNKPSTSKLPSMGPPTSLPKSNKRKIIHNSTSTRPESSSSGLPQPRVLALDSAAAETSVDFLTPRNRPTALRYISSSSRGGHSGNRSARSTSTSVVEASVILAIAEGRGMARGEIGMAAIDLRHPHLVLCQFSDTLLYTHTLTKINLFNPVEIIVPHTFCEGVQPNQLYRLIRDQYPLVNLTTVQRRHFNDAAGRQQIQTLCAPQYNGVCLQVLQKFYAVAAAAAVLKYVEYIQCIVFARESLKIEYHSSENTMVIDVGTATQLELVQPLVPSAGPTCCLLGVLGPTYTIGGIRALRAAILQPSCNKEFIEGRFDAIKDLNENENGLMTGLQDVVKKLADVDKILLLCMESQNPNMDKIGEAQLNQTLLLKTTMELVPKLVEALTVAESGRLRNMKIDFENPHYNEIAERIKTVLQDDAHLEKGAMGNIQRCFAVKPEINGLLDVARRTYSELIDDIQKMVDQLSESYDLPLRLYQNMLKGFHIAMSIGPKNRRNFNVENLPSIFIQVQQSGASVTMTTEELVVLDQQVKESLNEIQKMSNIVIASLLKELRPFMASLYKVCENVAELDILLALAQASSVGSFVRPEFNTFMDVKNSVHPLLDYNIQKTPVPNDIFASPEKNFTILTGPNMGGKSIYIKQIAIMQIMAQIGCFLPATSAVLRLCDRIFSRIGFNDSVELNASTFVIEMKEMQYIMTGLTKSSLVIIDELCRFREYIFILRYQPIYVPTEGHEGTSTEEGTSMAWAICEELLMRDAFIFFITHFMYLTRLEDLYHNVVNRQTAVSEEKLSKSQDEQKRLVYQHRIELGVTKVEQYGLALAEKTNVPVYTVQMARELADVIAKSRKPHSVTTPEINDEKLLYNLNAEIRLVARKHGDEVTKNKLKKFKEDHPDLIERLKIQRSASNNRTDSSANYTGSGSKENERTNNDKNANAQPTHEDSSDMNNGTLPQRRPNVLVSTSETDENVDETQNMVVHNKQFKRPLATSHASKVIYSTTTDEENTKLNSEFTSVKSSNELLTLIHVNKDNCASVDDRIKTFSKSKSSSASDPEQENPEYDSPQNHEFQNSVNVSSSSNKQTPVQIQPPDVILLEKTFSDCNINMNLNVPNTQVEMDEESTTESTNENVDIIDEDFDALTQVIEEYSNHDITTDLDNSDEMSVDEELMTETVNEIREELRSVDVSLENIILTPPMAFRD